MLDHPKKTKPLLAALKAALPFEVDIAPHIVAEFSADHPALAVGTPVAVSDVLYAGDDGGIMCAIILPEDEEALVVSLTFVRNPRPARLAAPIAAYQRHRRKKLRKQGDYDRAALNEPVVLRGL
jgi:hypothetical protein